MPIIWEAIEIDTVTWEASSVLTSGAQEPTWPEEADAFVSDNNIAWKTVPLRIEDENCPHSKVVAIASSKVFAGDRDVVRFCATLNARDWTSQDDAGFLPTGLQQKSQVGVDVMNVYRGNLAVWSGSTFQVWQTDPDPAAMALIDAMEGIGSVHQQAAQSIADDLFFLAALGVRTVSISAGTESLASGDVGKPIDPLVQASVTVDAEPISTYYPSAGQYWLAFRELTVPALAAGAFLLTSTVYPIEGMDELAWVGAPTGGTEQQLPIESMQFSCAALDSQLESILGETEPQVDELEFQASALDSNLDLVLLEAEVQVDELEFQAVCLDSTLEFALVRHEQPAESLDWTAAPTGGTSTPV